MVVVGVVVILPLPPPPKQDVMKMELGLLLVQFQLPLEVWNGILLSFITLVEKEAYRQNAQHQEAIQRKCVFSMFTELLGPAKEQK